MTAHPLVCDKHLQKTAPQIAKDKERNTMLDNQFQFAILATEDRIRAIRSQKNVGDAGIKRIFRLGGDRQLARQLGRR